MISLYSDASFEDGQSVISYLALDKAAGTFLNFRVEPLPVPNGSFAELYAVVQGLEWCASECPGMPVTVFTDAKFIVVRMKNYPRDTTVVYNDMTQLWLSLFSLVDRLNRNVVFEHIQSHQRAMNPNKACDMLSHRVLKILGEEAAKCLQSAPQASPVSTPTTDS